MGEGRWGRGDGRGEMGEGRWEEMGWSKGGEKGESHGGVYGGEPRGIRMNHGDFPWREFYFVTA